MNNIIHLYQNNENEYNKYIDTFLLKGLRFKLNNLLFNQEEAINKVVDKLYLYKSGLSENGINKPIASFIFAGKTGTGKTELAKLLAKELNLNFLRLDMSEYKLKHYQSNLLGSPSGYVGSDKKGILLKNLENNPYSVILFDEMEKANDSLYDLLLQILDYGILTDASTGEKIDFTKSIIIFTSNLGSQEKEEKFGFHNNEKTDSFKENINQAISEYLKPEFIARVDNLVIFNELSEQTYIQVIEKEFNKIKTKLDNKSILFNYINIDLKQFFEFIKLKSFKDQILGVREIKKLIEDEILIPISQQLLINNNLKEIKIDIKENNIVFNYL